MPVHQNISTKNHGTPADHQESCNTDRSQRSAISLTDLPSNVLVEILAKLPPRTLFVARTVCKTFVSLTTANPHFINLHSSTAPQILVVQFGGFKSPSRLIHMSDNVFNYKKSQLRPLFQFPKIVKQYNPYLLNSCNGVLHFRQLGPANSPSLSLVCNPVTCEYITIPDAVFDPKTRLHSGFVSFCLGFSPGANQYKLLTMCWWKNAAGSHEFSAQVWSGSWRNVDDTTLHMPHCTLDFFQAQHVNGVMYWPDRELWPGAMISFDFEREKFGEVTLPPEFQSEGFITKHETSLGVLGGCLCLSCNNFDAHRVDLWVMRKCGNQDSWTKDFVIDTVGLRVRGGPVYGQFKPLQFIGNGEILMQWTLRHSNRRENTLVCYDPRTVTLTYFVFDRVERDYKVMTLTPSFVPLKDALKVEKVLSGLRPRGDQAIINIMGF